MKLSEANYRTLFKATVIIKGLIAIGEVALGFLFAFLSYDVLFRFAAALTGDELMEHPQDLLWGIVATAFRSFTSTPRSVWAFIFLSHGVVKLILIAALLYNKEWAFPWSATIFTGFIAYQIWQMVFTPSWALAFITVLDAIVVILILHEYRLHKRRRREAAAIVL